MTEKFTHKLGVARKVERSRIWLEGERLLNAGFKKGDRFKKTWSDGKLKLSAISAKAAADLARSECGTVSGSDTRPVIDIVGDKVRETFKGETVEVTFTTNYVHIRG